jgi:YEATS family
MRAHPISWRGCGVSNPMLRTPCTGQRHNDAQMDRLRARSPRAGPLLLHQKGEACVCRTSAPTRLPRQRLQCWSWPKRKHQYQKVQFPQVVFQLHSSFAVPLRPVEHQPYEVVEGGWGEFEIGIQVRIYLVSAPIWKMSDKNKRVLLVLCWDAARRKITAKIQAI